MDSFKERVKAFKEAEKKAAFKEEPWWKFAYTVYSRWSPGLGRKVESLTQDRHVSCSCIYYNSLSVSSSSSRIHLPIINEHHDYLLFSLCLTDPSMNPNLTTKFFASSSEIFTFVSLGIFPAFCCFAHSSRIRWIRAFYLSIIIRDIVSTSFLWCRHSI